MRERQCAKESKRAAQPISPSVDTDHEDWQIEVFFDGDCPLCRREISMLRRLDRKKRICFTDIATEDFDPSRYGTSYQQLMTEIHARTPNGTWITGVEVFRRLYGAVGFRWLVPVTRLPGISCGLEFGYQIFARNRLNWTGRCSANRAACQIGNSER